MSVALFDNLKPEFTKPSVHRTAGRPYRCRFLFFIEVNDGLSLASWSLACHRSKCKSMLISHDYVMFYDVLSQNGQRPRLIRNNPAKDQSAFASAHRSILRFI